MVQLNVGDATLVDEFAIAPLPDGVEHDTTDIERTIAILYFVGCLRFPCWRRLLIVAIAVSAT